MIKFIKRFLMTRIARKRKLKAAELFAHNDRVKGNHKIKKEHKYLEHSFGSEFNENYNELDKTWNDIQLIEALRQVQSNDKIKALNARPKQPALKHALVYGTTACFFVSWFFFAVPDNHYKSYSTVRAERAEAALEDGSTVKLNGLSSMEVQFSDKLRRTILFKGEAFFDVVKNESRPFIVDTDLLSIEVVGTQFNVDLLKDQIEVSVFEGTVKVKVRDEFIDLAAGQKVTVSLEGIAQIINFDVTQMNDWRQGWIEVNNLKLADVVLKLNRLSTKAIVVSDPQLNQQIIVGRFRTEDIQETLKTLGFAYGFRTYENDYNVYLVPSYNVRDSSL